MNLFDEKYALKYDKAYKFSSTPQGSGKRYKPTTGKSYVRYLGQKNDPFWASWLLTPL